MIIGLPKEIKIQEHRVALVPAGVRQLVKQGHTIVVEQNAGTASGYPDADYLASGAEILATHEEIFARADLIIKVKEPIPSEYPLLRPGQILFTYLHLAANPALTQALISSGCTAIAYETISSNRRLPLLEPMSEIAGRMSVIMGAHTLAKHSGGTGILLGGVPGVLPGNVVILGGGTAGFNAARMALGLGANVTILELDLERIRYIDVSLPGIRTAFSSEAQLEALLPTVDLLIGAVLVPGAKAPRLVTREMLRKMRPGSVFVDIAIDQGGCAETSRPTTHDNPTFIEEGIVHYCVANMPGAYARTATQALTNATFPYLQNLASHNLSTALTRQPALLPGIATMAGQLHCEKVAQALGLPHTPYLVHP